MQRVLDPAEIEGFAQRSIPRVILPDPGTVFARRAARLRALSPHHAVGDYLQLMAVLSEAQQHALTDRAEEVLPAPLMQRVSQAGTHGMPLLPAIGWPRETAWQSILLQLCEAIRETPGFPGAVSSTVERVASLPAATLEHQADLLLSASDQDIDVQGAPFLMAALQVYWVQRLGALRLKELPLGSASVVCPVCGSLPVASIVRADKEHAGYRYLCCPLCATAWHMVRVKCSHCQSTAGIHYQSIEGGSTAIRAEACDECRTYRKIFYQEHDLEVEAVADDLASLAIDLLMSEAGLHRASGNPLLWQHTAG